MLKKFLYSLLVITALISTSCDSRNEKGVWLKTWLSDPKCLPPCWEDIIPGATTVDETVAILESKPGIIINEYPTGTSRGINFRWEFEGTKDTGGVWSNSEFQIVDSIYLRVINSNLAVSEVVSEYGYPSHVRIGRCFGELFQGGCNVDLIYLDSGLILELFPSVKIGDREARIILVKPMSKITRIDFIPPGPTNYGEFRSLNEEEVEESLIEWIGYEEYMRK